MFEIQDKKRIATRLFSHFLKIFYTFFPAQTPYSTRFVHDFLLVNLVICTAKETHNENYSVICTARETHNETNID
jgi:hypothetical protein